MSRRPYPQEMALRIRVPRGFEGYWEIINQLADEKGVFSLSDIDGRSNTERTTTRDYVRRLVRAGYLQLDHEEPRPQRSAEKFYRLARKSADAPRVRRDGSEAPRDTQWRLWSAIRGMRRGFTIREVAFTAGLEEAVPHETAKSYVCRLHKAGYLITVGAVKAPKPATFRLVLDTGPRPPRILSTRAVWDQNKGEIVGPVEAELSS